MTSAAVLMVARIWALGRASSLVACVRVMGRAQTNPDTLGAGDADEAGEQVAVGGEGAGHGAQDACAVPGGQENTVSGAFNQRVADV